MGQLYGIRCTHKWVCSEYAVFIDKVAYCLTTPSHYLFITCVSDGFRVRLEDSGSGLEAAAAALYKINIMAHRFSASIEVREA